MAKGIARKNIKSVPLIRQTITENELKDRCGVLQIINRSGEAIEITSNDLYWHFDIKKTNKENPNESDFKILGLNLDHLNFVDGYADYIMCYAGYNGKASLLFEGVIDDVFNSWQDDGIVETSIKATDGSNSYRYASVNKSYPAGTKVKDILSDLANVYGVNGIDLKDIPDNLQFQNARTLNGSATKHLREICNYAGLEFSIQNNVLQVQQKGAWNDGWGYVLSKETGLIGSPQRKKSKRQKQSNISDDQDGISNDDAQKLISVQSLLIPELVPNTVVKVESIFLNDYYVIREAHFSGSPCLYNNDSQYMVDLQVEEIVQVATTPTNIKPSTGVSGMDISKLNGNLMGQLPTNLGNVKVPDMNRPVKVPAPPNLPMPT